MKDMKKLLKSAGNIRGTVSAEAAVASAAMILLFAVFISIAGYCRTASEVKTIVAEKAMESSLVMYAGGFTLPAAVYSKGNDWPAMAKRVTIYGVISDDSIKVVAQYRYPSIFGEIKTRVSAVCSLWNGDEKIIYKDDCVWDLAPNKRGTEIESIFGGNLPEFFPVLDCFDFKTGEAVSIISIDTTLAVYATGSEIRKVIMEKAKKLKDFISGTCDDVEVKKGEIRSIKLLVVIPENQLSEDQKFSLENTLFDTMNMGISVEVRRFQIAGE